MKKKYFKRVMGVLLSFLLFFGVLPMDAFHLHGHEGETGIVLEVQADWEEPEDCEHCGGSIYGDWICDGGTHCGENSDRSDCYEAWHCPGCQDCIDNETDLCGGCSKCDSCATICEECGEKCTECADWICDDCGKCAECVGDTDYCKYCDLCIECAGGYVCVCQEGCSNCSLICEECGEKCFNCSEDEMCSDCGRICKDCAGAEDWCDNCNRCRNCAGYICECGNGCGECTDVCECEKNCENCTGLLCNSCGMCYDCVGDGGWCDECNNCGECVETCICGGGCSECATVCPDCNEKCTNCADAEICGGCNVCKDCVGGEGSFCDNCETCINCVEYICYNGDGCSECTVVCESCTEQCENCGILCGSCGICSECAGDFCENCGMCGDCAFVCSCGYGCNECSVICGECFEACENCTDELCADCENCIDCVGADAFCYTCMKCADCTTNPCVCGGSCEECGIVCSDCGEHCQECYEFFCDDCGLCRECAGEDQWCEYCNRCLNCTEVCEDCGLICKDCANAWCEDCGTCSDCVELYCPDCGICQDCASGMCEECGYCEDCAGLICISCESICDVCSVICGTCETCENCTDICQDCGECEECCAENALDRGCVHEICPESQEWKQHYCTVGNHCIDPSIAGKYGHDEYSHWNLCGENCSGKLNEQAHLYGKGVITREATTTVAGIVKLTCTQCGYVKEEKISKVTGSHVHKFEELVVPADCMSIGYTVHECECGAFWMDSMSREVDHSYLMEYDAKIHWGECEWCHQTLDESTHVFSPWEVVKEPKYIHEGVRSRSCAVCDYTIAENIPTISYKGRFVVVLEDGKGNVVDELLSVLGEKTVPTLPKLEAAEGKRFKEWVEKATGKAVKQGDLMTGNMTLIPVWTTSNGNVTEIFEDISESKWYVEAVQYVYDEGLMSGNDGLFKPTDNITRAQLVTTLYRLAGSPVITNTSALTDFSDVATGKYYTDAVCWAYREGIATGNDGKFDPTGKLTRQQMAAFFYRYAEVMGDDVTVRADYSTMLNADQVSGYAKDAVSWAVGEGLISGSQKEVNGMKVYDLNPRGNTTRAQVATILQRFCEK